MRDADKAWCSAMADQVSPRSRSAISADSADSADPDDLTESDASGDRLLREIARVPAALPPRGEPDRTGTKLARFKILSRLGQGGMGIVYLAEDTRLRRRVALKVLPAAVADEERRKRFLREARSASAVVHPNVATVFDADEADDAVFIAMEYVEGRTLRRVIEDERLALPEVLRIATEIARGLAKAHEAGITHRDLKPDNVMLDADGHVKILDFGLAKLRAAEADDPSDNESDFATREGRVLGTPSYMSPEQAKGQTVDVRSDVFSLGVVIYEMVSGSRPFTGTTATEILIAIDRDPPPPFPREARVPRDLERVVLACLGKRPEDRPGDAGAVVALLDGVRPGAAGASRARWAVAGTCLVVAIAGGAWWYARPRAAPPRDISAAEPPPPRAATIATRTAAAAPPPVARAAAPAAPSPSSVPRVVARPAAIAPHQPKKPKSYDPLADQK